MDRMDYLLQRFIENELTDDERAELEVALAQREGADHRFVRDLEVEALLRSTDTTFDVCKKVMPRVHAHYAEKQRQRQSIGVHAWNTHAAKMGRKPWIFGILLLAAIGIGAGALGLLRTPIATITYRDGISDARQTGQRMLERPATPLKGGEHVGIARNTTASIALPDGVQMEVGLEADLTLVDHTAGAVTLASGRVRAQVPPNDRQLHIATPHGTATVTAGNAEIIANPHVMQVIAETGRVNVSGRSNAAPLTLSAGQYALVGDAVLPTAMPVMPWRCLFDEQPDPMAFWTAEAGMHAIVHDDSRSGTASLRITPQQGRVTLTGLALRVREHPQFGEYRFLRFAWRKDGGGRIALQLDHADDPDDRDKRGRDLDYRFDAGEGPRVNGRALRIDGRTPAAWWLVSRDLWEDFGDFTLTGLTFICPDGEAGWFDCVYIAQSPADIPNPAPATTSPAQADTPPAQLLRQLQRQGTSSMQITWNPSSFKKR